MVQTFNSINLCFDCIDNVINILQTSNYISTEDLNIYNGYFDPIPFMSEYPINECFIYGRLHASCKHAHNKNIHNICPINEPRTEDDIHALYVEPNKIQFTDKSRSYVLTNIAKDLKIARKQLRNTEMN